MDKQTRIFRALSDAGLLLVHPGFPVERRTLYGLHGDGSDLAISLKWHDVDGCEWEADFTEDNMANASVERNRIVMSDSEGGNVCVELYELMPAKL